MRLRPMVMITVLCALATGIAGCGGSDTTATGSSGTGSTAPPGPSGPGSDRSGATTVSADALSGTSWKLASYAGAGGTTIPAAAGDVAALTFAVSRKLAGSTGCNQFAGTYVVDGAKLTITLGPMTLAACPEPRLTAQQDALAQHLPEVTGFTKTADALTLTGPSGTLFTYSAGVAGLAGSTWQVTGVNNGKGAVQTSALTEKLTAVFGSDGAFSGFGGCNDLSGTYTTSGVAGLTITGLTATSKACAADATALEAEYTKALGQVTTYEISGDKLTMRDADRATQVTATLTA